MWKKRLTRAAKEYHTPMELVQIMIIDIVFILAMLLSISGLVMILIVLASIVPDRADTKDSIPKIYLLGLSILVLSLSYATVFLLRPKFTFECIKSQTTIDPQNYKEGNKNPCTGWNQETCTEWRVETCTVENADSILELSILWYHFRHEIIQNTGWRWSP